MFINHPSEGGGGIGSAAACVLTTPYYIYLVHCGDSKILLSRQKSPHCVITVNHLPSHRIEEMRIKKAGGGVSHDGSIMKNSSFLSSVSRSFGYREGKNNCFLKKEEQVVIVCPTIAVESRWNEEFVVIASKGVWDVLSATDVQNFVRFALTVYEDLRDICESIVRMAFNRESTENIAIVLLVFEHAPKVCPVVQKEYYDHLESLEIAIKNVARYFTTSTLNQLMDILEMSDFGRKFFPGHSLYKHRELISQVFNNKHTIYSSTNFKSYTS